MDIELRCRINRAKHQHHKANILKAAAAAIAEWESSSPSPTDARNMSVVVTDDADFLEACHHAPGRSDVFVMVSEQCETVTSGTVVVPAAEVQEALLVAMRQYEHTRSH